MKAFTIKFTIRFTITLSDNFNIMASDLDT